MSPQLNDRKQNTNGQTRGEELPPMTIIVGPRRSGKTHSAVCLARSRGPRVCMVVKHGAVRSTMAAYPDIEVTTERNRGIAKSAGTVFVLDNLPLRQAARFIAPDVEVIVTSCSPQTLDDDSLIRKLVVHGVKLLNAEDLTLHYQNHRLICAARTDADVAWVDSHWRIGKDERGTPMLGGRPRPLGCSGCTCVSATLADQTRLSSIAAVLAS